MKTLMAISMAVLATLSTAAMAQDNSMSSGSMSSGSMSGDTMSTNKMSTTKTKTTTRSHTARAPMRHRAMTHHRRHAMKTTVRHTTKMKPSMTMEKTTSTTKTR